MPSQEEEIAARVGLDATPLARGVRAIHGQLTQLGNSIKKQFAEVGASIAGVFAVRKAVEFGKSILDFADQLKAASDRLGASVEFIQGFNFAASQTGVGTQNATQALDKFSQKIGDAANGNAEAAASFTKLGVAIFNRFGELKSTEQLYLDVADAIKNLPDPALKSAAAFDLFGKAGAKLIPLLNEGSAGFDKLSNSIKKLSDEDVQKLDAIGDKLEELGTRAKVGGGSFLAAFLDLTKGKFREAQKEARDFAEAIAQLPGIRQFGFAGFKSLEQIEGALNGKKTTGGGLLGLEGLSFFKLFGRGNVGDNTPASEIDKQRKAALDAAVKERKAQEEADQKHLAAVQQEANLRSGIRKDEQDLKDAKLDRSKFTLEQIANSDPRTVLPGARQDIFQARRALLFELRAKRRASRGDLAGSQADFNQSDEIKKGISFLNSKEADPFKDLKTRLTEQNQKLTDFLDREALRGINIQPKNGK